MTNFDDNVLKVQQGFRILHEYLAGYVCQELLTEYGENDWWKQVCLKLDDQDDLRLSGTYVELMDSLDIPHQ